MLRYRSSACSERPWWSVTGAGLSHLLEFLSGSFHGGTDVDEPFIRALARLQEAEWSNADIMLVTDGEIRPPDQAGPRSCGLTPGPPRVHRAWSQRLDLKYDEPLSSFAFDLKLRPYDEEMVAALTSAKDTMGLKVRRLTPHPLRIP